MRSETEMRILGPELAGGAIERPEAGGEAGAFARELGKAIEEVDRLQLDADHQADLVARGGGNLHELAIALEKADVTMRLALKVRNKALEAYNEIMRMSV